MADQLDMNGLSLNGSQARSYIPPHLRGAMGGPPTGPPGPAPGMDGGPPVMKNGVNGSAWAAPSAYVHRFALIALRLL